jgi:uncharacterized membrane protein YphA (DoxX/SURF4 family)
MTKSGMTNFGIRVYGLAAIALGLVGLVWDDFASVWQPVPAGVPGRAILAYITAALLILGGAALNVRRTAEFGAGLLTVLYALGVVLLHLPRVAAHPFAISPWGGVAEQMALVAGGWLAYAAARDPSGAVRLYRIGWLVFGLCCVMFGAVHFRYAAATATMVPGYLPPNQIFWAYATGVAHIAAGLAILSGVLARLAARLLTAMFALFSILVHIPGLIADPGAHMSWTINAINLALIGAAWIVADTLATGESPAAWKIFARE